MEYITDNIILWSEYCEVFGLPEQDEPDWFNRDLVWSMNMIMKCLAQSHLVPTSRTRFLLLKQQYQNDVMRGICEQIKFAHENQDVIDQGWNNTNASFSLGQYHQGPQDRFNLDKIFKSLCPASFDYFDKIGWTYASLTVKLRRDTYYKCGEIGSEFATIDFVETKDSLNRNWTEFYFQHKLPDLPTSLLSGFLKATPLDGSYERMKYEWVNLSELTNAITWYEDVDGLQLWREKDGVESEITELAKFYNKTQVDDAIATKSTVSVSATGTSTDEVQYITIDGVEKKLAGGTTDYNNLQNKPSINNVTLQGNKAPIDLGIQTNTSTDLETQNKTIVGAINEVNDKAQGTTVNYVISLQEAENLPFVSTNDIITADHFVTLDGITIQVANIPVGTSVYNTDNAIPDRWYAGNNQFYILRGEAPDLTAYQTKQDSDLQTTNKTVVGAINENKGKIDALVPVITEITAHQTINTYQVPTLTTEQVQALYNSVVAGRVTQIHFDPSDLGIDTDYRVEQASNVSGIAIRFVYNDTMILTYTINGDNVEITYKGMITMYRHRLTFVLDSDTETPKTFHFYVDNNIETPFSTISRLFGYIIFIQGNCGWYNKSTTYNEPAFIRWYESGTIQKYQYLSILYFDTEWKTLNYNPNTDTFTDVVTRLY